MSVQIPEALMCYYVTVSPSHTQFLDPCEELHIFSYYFPFCWVWPIEIFLDSDSAIQQIAFPTSSKPFANVISIPANIIIQVIEKNGESREENLAILESKVYSRMVFINLPLYHSGTNQGNRNFLEYLRKREFSTGELFYRQWKI